MIAVSVGSSLVLWTFVSIAVLAGIFTVIALIALALFRRGRIKR